MKDITEGYLLLIYHTIKKLLSKITTGYIKIFN